MTRDHVIGDVLRPTAQAAADGWATRVRAARAQVERLSELGGTDDFYRPMARRFGQDPRRTGDAALEVLRSLASATETWLDLGAGGGRYALPLALSVRRVIAVEPSPSMVAVLREGMVRHGIDGVEVIEQPWPVDPLPCGHVALMAHVGYDIEDFAAFLDAAEAAAGRCVVIMRSSGTARASHALWPDVHGEPRVAYPMLPELLVLLVARGITPEVTIVERGTWGFDDRDELLEGVRRMLWLAPGSRKDQLAQRLVAERATERDGSWEVDWTPVQDGIVRWEPPA